jgi:hypothetical protein
MCRRGMKPRHPSTRSRRREDPTRATRFPWVSVIQNHHRWNPRRRRDSPSHYCFRLQLSPDSSTRQIHRCTRQAPLSQRPAPTPTLSPLALHFASLSSCTPTRRPSPGRRGCAALSSKRGAGRNIARRAAIRPACAGSLEGDQESDTEPQLASDQAMPYEDPLSPASVP